MDGVQLWTTEQLRGDSLLFTNKSSGIPRTRLIDLRRVKDLVDLRAPSGFELATPGLGTQCLKHAHAGAYSEPCQTSEIERFANLFSQNSLSEMIGRILNRLPYTHNTHRWYQFHRYYRRSLQDYRWLTHLDQNTCIRRL